MKRVEIKSRWSCAVLYGMGVADDAANPLREVVVKAVAGGAYLGGAYLGGANLAGADLGGAKLPAPTMLLLARWYDLTDELIADLMLFDAANHPDPTAFDRWAAGGECPYRDCHVARAALFNERAELWGKGQMCRPYDLAMRLLAERCPEWSDEERKASEAKFKKAVAS